MTAVEAQQLHDAPWWRPRLGAGIGLALRVLLSLGLLGAAFWLGSGKLDWSSIAALDARSLALCLALTAMIIVSLAWRWRAIIGAMSETGAVVPGLAAASRLTWISLAVNQVVPSVAGGDAARISQAAAMGVPLGRAAGSVLLDRLYGLTGLALLAVSGVHLLAPRFILPVLLAIASLGAIGLAVVIVGRLRLPGKLQAIMTAATLPWRKSVVLVLAAMLSHLANICIFLVIAGALGAQLPLLSAISVMSCVLFVTVLPISIAGWGVREFALVQAFGQMGIEPEKIVLSSVAYGLVILVTQASGFLLLVGRNRP